MRILFGVGFIVVSFALAFALSELYVLLRKKLNRPQYGVDVLTKFLRRDDYVSINGEIYQFSHFTRRDDIIDILKPAHYSNKVQFDGDIAFMKTDGLGYIHLHRNALERCDFIYGKYGLKWARNTSAAKDIEIKINQHNYG